MAKLIFGCGYLGGRVARRWLERGESVQAVTRRAARGDEFQRAGVQAIVADITKPETLKGLPQATTVLFAVGFDRRVGDTIENVYVNGLANVLDALVAAECSLERFIYISSTGVYGQSNGEWVDEESECAPIRDGGKACLAAERLLAAHPIGKKAVILRLAGIYGPDRVPRKRDLEEKKPLPVADGYLNLVHVDDAAGVIIAAEAYESKSAPLPVTFIVADGNPVRRRTYYRELARLLRIGEPEFRDPDASDQLAEDRRLGSKRARTTRMMRELKPTFHYPSYREGLASIVGMVAATSGES